MGLILIAVVVLLPVVFVITTYNALVALRNHIAEAWSNIDTELKRRYELIPNMVETVKGYAKHEHETLEQVVKLRNQCMSDHGSISHQEGTEKQLVGALQKLMLVVESYPELKANANFLELQKELANTEDRIQAARRFYNGNVRDYKNRCETFPGNLVAGMFNFKPHDFFNVDPAVREAPDVKF